MGSEPEMELEQQQSQSQSQSQSLQSPPQSQSLQLQPLSTHTVAAASVTSTLQASSHFLPPPPPPPPQPQQPRITDRLMDARRLTAFNYQLKNSRTNEEKLSDLKVLADSPSHILYQFFTSSGLRTLGEWVYEGSNSITENNELLSKIFQILRDLALKAEHLDSAQLLGLGIEKMQLAQEENEKDDVFNVFYKFYRLNKQVITDWLQTYNKQKNDPNFKRQTMPSERVKYPGTLNGPNPRTIDRKDEFSFRQDNSNQDQKNGGRGKYNSSSSGHPNGKSGSSSSSNMPMRGDSPPNSKKVRLNNGNAFPVGGYPNHTPSFPREQRNLPPPNFRKQVSFSQENFVRKFRKEDEPTVGDLTDAEIDAYVVECQKKKNEQTRYTTMLDMRSRDTQLEKENRNQLKESEKRERAMLDEIKPSIPWTTPHKLKDLCSEYTANLSKDSIEKDIHNERIVCKIQSLYNADSDIPNTPCYDNIINDQTAVKEPQRIYLNKIDTVQFYELMDIAMKSNPPSSHPSPQPPFEEDQQEMRKKVEKKVFKSILKKSREEKERQRRKQLEEKRKQAEDEEKLKKHINFEQILNFIKDHKNSPREVRTEAVQKMGFSETKMQNILANISIISRIQQTQQQQQSQQPGVVAGGSQPELNLSGTPSFPLSHPPNPQSAVAPYPYQLQRPHQQQLPPPSSAIPGQVYNQYPGAVPPFNNQMPPQNGNYYSPPLQQPPIPPRGQMMNGQQQQPQQFNSFSQQGQYSPPQKQDQSYQSRPPNAPQPYLAGAGGSGSGISGGQPPQLQSQVNNNGSGQYNQSYDYNGRIGGQQQQQPPPPPHLQHHQQQQGMQNSYRSPSQQPPHQPHPQHQQQPSYLPQSQLRQNGMGQRNDRYPPQQQQQQHQQQQQRGGGGQWVDQSIPSLTNHTFPSETQQQFEDRAKNVPCRNFHSELGCRRDICHFKHIQEFQGRPVNGFNNNGQRLNRGPLTAGMSMQGQQQQQPQQGKGGYNNQTSASQPMKSNYPPNNNNNQQQQQQGSQSIHQYQPQQSFLSSQPSVVPPNSSTR